MQQDCKVHFVPKRRRRIRFDLEVGAIQVRTQEADTPLCQFDSESFGLAYVSFDSQIVPISDIRAGDVDDFQSESSSSFISSATALTLSFFACSSAASITLCLMTLTKRSLSSNVRKRR